MKRQTFIIFILTLSINIASAQWKEANTGLPQNCDISSISIKNQNIFAGIPGYGVYLSSNNGRSWVGLNTGLPSIPFINSLAISGSNIFAGIDNKIYLSTNDGNSWDSLPSWHSDSWIKTIKINESQIYVGTTNDGLFLSSDSGKNWVNLNNGLPKNTCVNSIAINESNIFIGTGNYDTRIGNGVYVSTNNGKSWKAINKDLITYYKANVLVPNGSNLYIGTDTGLYFTSDNGSSWIGANNELKINAIAFDDSCAFVGTFGSGVYLTTDSGKNFIDLNNGLPKYTSVRSLVVNNKNIYAGTDHGMYLSSNKGENWNKVDSMQSLSSGYVNSIATYKNYICAATDTDVFVSENNGMNWASIKKGLPKKTLIDAITIVDSIIYLGTWNKGVYYSTIKDTIWNALNSGLPTNSSIKSFLVNANNLYLITTVGAVFLLSKMEDTWTVFNTNGIRANSFAINGNNVFVGSETKGVFMSMNDVNNWTDVSNGLPTSTIITSLSIFENTILAATWFNGVYKSSDLGSSWTVVNKGLSLDSATVRTFAIYGDTIFAGIDNRYHHGSGFYLSKDKGQSWAAQSKGFPANTCVYSIAISDSFIFAGTWGSGGMDGTGIYDIGMWKRPLSDFNPTDVKNIDFNSYNAVYPNPVNNWFTIELSKENKDKRVPISVYDLQGRLVLKKLLLTQKSDINMSSFKSGIYIIKMVLDNKIENFKIFKD